MENSKNFDSIKDVSSIKMQNNLNSSTLIKNSTNKKIDRFKIIKNMEEVLKLVRKQEHKKHHHKHKHNKANKKICSKLLNNSNINEIADISNKLDSTSTSPNLMKPKQKNVDSTEKLKPYKENRLDMKGKRKKKLKDEKTETNINSVPNEISEEINASFTSPKKLITGHFLLTPKKLKNKNDQTIKNNLDNNNTLKSDTSDFDKLSTLEKNKKLNLETLNVSKINAFELLMSSRNKLIGRNSPGKELFENENNCDETENFEQKKSKKSKRKILLQELVDNKVGTKRKYEELDESRGEYIELQLNKRAKRLKGMLTDSQKVVGLSSPEMNGKINEKPVKQLKNATKRSKRSNTINLSTNELVTNIPNEDAIFIAKLSSPIKKRDNLLGYFTPKTTSPIIQDIETNLYATPELNMDIKTPKRRGRPKRTECSILKSKTNDLPSKSASSESLQNLEDISTPTRPRRLCVGEARYDYDLETSPVKMKENNDIEFGEEDVIDTEKSFNVPKKLAPLFIKSMPKPSVDPEIIKARQQFLMSGVPDIMKKEMAKQKIFEEHFEASTNIFPTIAHVPPWQIENIALLNKYSFKIKCFQMKEPKLNIKKSSNKLKNLICSNLVNNSKLLPLKVIAAIDNKKYIVKTLKNLYEKFPTYKCYNQLRQKYHFFSSSDTGEDYQQVTDSFMVTRRSNRNSSALAVNADDIKPPPSAPNGELLFTEKYKALSSDQILVNLSPVNALKEFLSGWQNINNINKDESFNSFEDSTGSIQTSVNTIVLVGPKSSGKTSAVFALANEMNFQILEVNAGMKRTGKKLLQDLQEATQSHQVRKDTNLIKKSSENTKLKKNKLNQNTDTLLDFSSEKMSLILLEDADIVFEQHDSGFVDAIYQLTATSKRPVVITANSDSCQHLNRLINNNSIYFTAPNPQSISKFISILTLIENCPIAVNDIVSLYLFNAMDLRKTILEIQFFIQSGGDRQIMNKNNSKINSFYAASNKNQNESTLKKDNIENSFKNYMHSNLFNFYINSQNFQIKIPIPINYNILWNNLTNIFFVSKKLKEIKGIQLEKTKKICNLNVLNDLVDFYENISIANYLDKPTNFSDRLKLNLGEEISYYLVENSLKENLNADNCQFNLYDEPQEERMALTKCISNSGFIPKNKSIALDYEPHLRAICRSEKERLLIDRRGSRFSHYLRNKNSFSTNLFDDSCKIFMDFKS